MDLGGLNIKDPLGTRAGETPSLYGHVSGSLVSFTSSEGPYLLGEVGHGESLVEKSEFSVLALLVIGVTENTTVQECSVNIGNHGPDVPSRVRRLARWWELD